MYEYVPVRQGSPQEPRTPEQATATMPAPTPDKMDLSVNGHSSRTGRTADMDGTEEALLVVAVYDAGTLIHAVDRGSIARRSKAALLVWRAGELLSTIGDAQQDWCRS